MPDASANVPETAANGAPDVFVPQPSYLAWLFADTDADARYAWARRRRNRLVLDVPRSQLDEVMLALRDEAKARAHTVLLVLIALVVMALPFGLIRIAERFEGEATSNLLPLALGVGLLFAGTLLPTWILAWRLPGPASDEPAPSRD